MHLLSDMFGPECFLRLNKRTLCHASEVIEVYLSSPNGRVFCMKPGGYPFFTTTRKPDRRQPLLIRKADFGTFRSWLHNVPEDDEEVYHILLTLIRFSGAFDPVEMTPFREYALNWVTRRFRRNLERNFS